MRRAVVRLAPLLFVMPLGGCGAGVTKVSVPPAPVAQAVTAPTSAPKKEVSAPERRPMDAATARMERLALVWGEVRYRHPYLWEGRGIDWDAALLTALPQMEAAQTDEDERAVLQRMLDTLHDPLTRVMTAGEPRMATVGPEARVASRSWEGKTTLVLRLGPKADLGDEQMLRADLLTARTLVVDLRVERGEGWEQSRALERLADVLVSRSCVSPALRGLLHVGYRPQRGWGGQSYFTGAREVSATGYAAGKRAHPLQVIAVVNPWSILPDVLLAMQQTGDARIVSERELIDPADRESATVALPGAAFVSLRTEETTVPVRANLLVLTASAAAGSPADAAMGAALKLARSPAARRSPAPAPPLPPLSWQPDAEYATDAYPSRELRELALVRFWNVIRLFYPARHLIESEQPWEAVFAEMLPRMQRAGNAREYTLAVAALAAKVHDCHVFLASGEMGRFFGRPVTGLEVRRIEARPIITEVTPAQAAAGLHIGDEIVTIDGASFASRVARVEPYVAASNPWTLVRDTYRWALHGPSPEAAMQVRGADGRLREVHVARVAVPPPNASSAPQEPPYKLLENGAVGYVDLGKLGPEDVDPMFAALGQTRAIVFDMRSYPRGTMMLIAPRINVRHPAAATRFIGPAVGLMRDGHGETMTFEQQVAPTTEPVYRGVTVMLIDERTQSQAEHTGLFFEAAGGTKFIGSPSVGADGDITQTTVPGGIAIAFSGYEVVHADGRQLQRVGLQPDIPVSPTVAGIRAGRDEVLDRALTYLKDLAHSPAR